MIAVSPPLTDPRSRHERLSNWLALLALLAGGIVFEDADEAAKAGSDAAAHRLAASGAAAVRRDAATASSPDIATAASASGAACALATCYTWSAAAKSPATPSVPMSPVVCCAEQ